MPAVLVLVRCQKPPDFSTTPVIKFVNFNLTTVHPDKDSLKLTFSFTDGDGDLGYQQGQNTNGDTTIHITDVRVDKKDYTYVLEMPYIDAKGSYKQISGNVVIDMINICHCRPDHLNTDTVWYRVKVRDRAGHESNEITTPQVILQCN